MANIHITSALPPSNAAICGHWTRETAQKTAIRAVNPCSPKAEVTGSNPVGCTINIRLKRSSNIKPTDNIFINRIALVLGWREC